jgi:hypothetical protein
MQLGHMGLGSKPMGLVHMVVGDGVGRWRQQLPLEQREPEK